MPGSQLIRGNRRTTFAGLFLAIALAFVAFAASAPKADAAPVSITFDNGRLTIGSIFDNRVILPATDTFPSDDLPAPQRTDIQLMGDLTGGKITIPAAANTGLQFPYMNMLHPLTPDLRIPITMRLNEPGLTGTWKEETGAMTLKGKLDMLVITGTGATFPVPDALVDVGVPPLGLLARCRINDVPVNFTTATKRPTTAQPFTGGFGTKGALTTNWDGLPKAASENGGDCGDLNNLLNIDGGLWLSNGIVDPIPQERPQQPKPTCATDLTLCPQPAFSDIASIRLTPRRKAVRAGRAVTMRIKVRNAGDKAAKRVRVRLRSSNPAVKVPRTVTLKRIPANRSATRKFRVRVGGKASGRARIIARTSGRKGAAVLKIKG